jgi:hypothetical protein
MGAQRGMQFNCDRTWESLQQRGADRSCDRCAKPVLDLTRLDRTELKALYAVEPATCGRFTLEQVEPDLTPIPALPQQALKGALAALTILTLRTTHAQVPTRPAPATEQSAVERTVEEGRTTGSWERCWIDKEMEIAVTVAPSKPRVRYYWSKRFPFVHKRRQFRFIGCPSF